ncbi:fumarylacetoacetate hydrolase family protein [Methylopila sp. M107]|uniref:2-keto-4-pentenoate hydratase n=1 Tax=Methylopila sp. M107 TaxID=1101190 RepID=UPI00036F8115|nr:fumarylacetoacetate hydrolase family protein [Methylopila sp. M107]
MTADTDKIDRVARLLSEARQPGEALAYPPADLAPADAAEAWAIHQASVAGLGPVIGWKVGAATPEADIILGEITASTLFRSPATLPASVLRLWAVEAEIAVTFDRDLAEEGPVDAEEILAAIGSWHAAIEVLDTAFADWKAAPALWKVADRQSHGALILGAGSPQRPIGPLDKLPVRLLVDGAVAFAHEGGNTGGDPTRLLVALAEKLSTSGRPIRAGDVVTTGSTTPFLQAKAGQRVRVEFDGLDPAELVVGG